MRHGPAKNIIHLLACGLVFSYTYPYKETLKRTFARFPAMAALSILPVVSDSEGLTRASLTSVAMYQ